MPRKLSVFCAPERYVQGKDATQLLGEEMQKLGLEGPVFIVACRAAQEQLPDVWRHTFNATKTPTEYFVHPFGGECSAAEINAVVDEARRRGCRVIVGAGGGKVIDTARAAADLLNVPVVSCPTVASSDAPCSALSVVYTPEGAFDEYRFFKRHPVLVLVDTQVIARSPRRTLVGGLGDALATWFEARTVREACTCNFFGAAPTQAGTALAKLCYDILLADGPAALEAVDCKACTPALERVVEANTLLSGLGFENGGLAVAHSLHNGLTVVPGTHAYTHGEKVAFGLVTQLVLEGRPRAELQTVLTYCETVGLPTTLAQVGVDAGDDDAIQAIAERTVAAGETAHNEPFEVTADAVADAIRGADVAGSRHKDL